MAFVTYFKQYLSKKAPEKNKELLTLYNYLRCFCPHEQTLTKEVLDQFLRKTLLFPHWQTNFNHLHESLKKQLEDFSNLYYSAELNPEELTSNKQWQWLNLQEKEDLLMMVQNHLEKTVVTSTDKMKVLPLSLNRVLALVLKLDGSLEIRTFGPMALIREGNLEPLSPLSELYYSPEYELKSSYPQILEDMQLGFIHFKLINGKATGFQSENFFFQISTKFTQKNLHEIYPLFYLLKKQESLFIQSKSDPHYKKLIQSLHEHYKKLLVTPLNNNFKTEQILSEAKNALKNIYPQDRLLFLLTANIDFHFRKHKESQPQLAPNA